MASYTENYSLSKNSRSMNVRNKWNKSQPNPKISKDFEPITFWVTAPMAPRFNVQSDVMNLIHMINYLGTYVKLTSHTL